MTTERGTEDAIAFLMGRVRFYAREGTTSCGTCGAAPPEDPGPFRPTMPCGHPWTALVWTRRSR